MTNRPIVRDTAIAGGRWRFEETPIFVDTLRTDYQRSGETIRDAYLASGLSDAEFDAAVAFRFPAIREQSAELEGSLVHVNCVCGIDRYAVVDAKTMNLDICPCGRTWHLSLHLADFRGTEPGLPGTNR